AQAAEAPRAHLVRHHARNAAAQGLPADHEPRAAAQGLDGALPGLLEDRLTVGGASAPPGLAARPHVWKLEARDADSSRRELPGEVIQEGCVDRKSTRLNSSHVSISYAVFCLKKKIIENPEASTRLSLRD